MVIINFQTSKIEENDLGFIDKVVTLTRWESSNEYQIQMMDPPIM